MAKTGRLDLRWPGFFETGNISTGRPGFYDPSCVSGGDEVPSDSSDGHVDARCIDWGVFADAGKAVRAKAILGEDTPWTRLFELAELPSYRLITVEFLSTFRYRAHQHQFGRRMTRTFLQIFSSP
ncbi:hypothetical protein R6Q57_029061 [Mikania cordata]